MGSMTSANTLPPPKRSWQQRQAEYGFRGYFTLYFQQGGRIEGLVRP
jgi:hypothetical protein